MNWPSHLGLWSPHLSPGQHFSKGYKSFQGRWALLSPGEPQLGLTIASWAEERETGGELLGLQVRGSEAFCYWCWKLLLSSWG